MDKVIDLNNLDMNGTVICPYCGKGKDYIYNASGKVSHPCVNCKRMVLWDYDSNTAFKARVKKYVS